MKLKITKTKLDKELKDFVSKIKTNIKELDAYRSSLYSTDGTQKISFIFEQLQPKSKSNSKNGSFLFKF